MTYCVGWKSLNHVFFISDTARTVKSETYIPTKLMSSTGEETLQSESTVVEEFIHKQFRIGNNCILTFAGDINISLEIISCLNRYYNPSNPLQSFELALDSVRNPDRPNSIKFLIAMYHANETKLYAYNLDSDKQITEIPEGEIIQIGSLSSTNLAEVTTKMYHDHVKQLKDPSAQFYQMIGFLLHYGVHNQTFLANAGGLYTGLFLSPSGNSWMDDTMILYYDRTLERPDEIDLSGRINCFMRHDVLVLTSSYTNQGEYFINFVDNPVYKSKHLERIVHREHIHFNPKVLIFIAKDEKIITILKSNGHNKNNYFVYENDEGKQGIYLFGDLMDILKGKVFEDKKSIYVFWEEFINVIHL